MPEQERAVVIAGLESVDYVCIFSDRTPCRIIDRIPYQKLISSQICTYACLRHLFYCPNQRLIAQKSFFCIKLVADCLLNVPSENTPRIQEMHILLIHTLCGLIEKGLQEQGFWMEDFE